MFKGHNQLTKEDIYKHTTEVDLFKKYCPNFKLIGHKFMSDERPESVPSCCISVINGRLIYKDFGNNDGATDIWGFLQKKFNCDFKSVLDKVASDIGLPIVLLESSGTYIPKIQTYTAESIGKIPNKLSIKKRDWNTYDRDYWYGRYQIPQRLIEEYDVFPISHFWINNLQISADKLAYTYNYYYYKNVFLRKIYQPLKSKDHKWLSNINITVVQGIANIPKTASLLIVTKSLKDVMILRMLGYVAVAPNNETSWIPEEVWTKFISRYLSRVILFDSDLPGIENAQKFSSLFNIPNIIVPYEEDVKDISDFVMKYRSLSLAKELIEEKLRYAGITNT